MSVSIVKADLTNVKEQVKLLLENINYTPKKRQVFIKPNLVAAVPPERGVITHPQVTAAVIEFLQAKECEVVIAESSSVAQDTDRVFKMTGYSALAEHYGVKLINLNDAPKVKKEWKYGTLELPELVYSHEYINIAKMKTHIGARVTLGIKNQKGLITNSLKKKFHIKYDLDEAIRELYKVVKPDLTIIDGIIALEGDGPGGAGEAFDMNLLLAGQNILEVDNVAIRTMGFKSGEVEHIPPLDNIKTIGEPIEKVAKKFKRAQRHKLNLENITYTSYKGCSGCTERFAIGLRRADKTRFTVPFNLIAGIDPELNYPELQAVCFGNCTKKFSEKHSLPFIPGCPPNFELVDSIPDLINMNNIKE